MTRPFQERITCPSCGIDVSTETAFSQWIRNHPGLDSIKKRLCVIDTDYWIHQYRAHHDQVGARAVDSIMCIELKKNDAGVRFAQRDTLYLIDQLLRRACTRKDGRRKYVRMKDEQGKWRIVRCFGTIVLRISGECPETSDRMLWDGKLISIDMLVELLRFDRDPHNPMKPLEYRRHHKPSLYQAHPQLFGDEAA